MIATRLRSLFASSVGSVFVFVFASPGTTCHVDLTDQSPSSRGAPDGRRVDFKTAGPLWAVALAPAAAAAEGRGGQSDKHANLGTASPRSRMKGEGTTHGVR